MSIIDEIDIDYIDRNDVGERFKKYVDDLEKLLLENLDDILLYIYNKANYKTPVGIREKRGIFKPYEYLDVTDLVRLPRKVDDEEGPSLSLTEVEYYTDGTRIWMQSPFDKDWRKYNPTLASVGLTHVDTRVSIPYRDEKKYGVVDKNVFARIEIRDSKFSSYYTINKLLKEIKLGNLTANEYKRLNDFMNDSPKECLKKHIKDRLEYILKMTS